MSKPKKQQSPPAKRIGRPPSADPKSKQYAFRLTAQEVAEYRREIERLSAATGTDWDMSKYARMAMRAMLGRHLPGEGGVS